MDKKKINALLQNLENEIKQKAVTNLEKQKPINQIASAIGGLYYAIYHISLTDDSFICFREDNKSVNDVVGTRGSFRIISGNPRFFKCRDESIIPCFT